MCEKKLKNTDYKHNMYEQVFDGVVCFGGEDWWYHNRAHIDMQLMRRFARLGTTIYINSLVMQKPNLGEGKKFIQKLGRKSKSILRGLKKTDAGFWVYSPFSLPVHHIAPAKTMNELLLQLQISYVIQKLALYNPIVWVACPVACDIALKMKKSKLVYQRTDRFEEYPGVDKQIIATFDAKLKAHADLTIFVNESLYKEEARQCKKALYLDHGVDFEMFALAEQQPYIPPDIANIKRPIVGFFGGIAEHTFDIALMEEVVGLLPELSFVFIGSSNHQGQLLSKYKNVWMLGQKPYQQIPHYGKCFDVAIMPWKQNRWIQACNPIKLKEYLALGKPVVSTPFSELQKHLDVIYQAKTPQEFARCIEKAIAEDNSEQIAIRRMKVQYTSWESKGQLVLKKLFGE